MARLNVEERYFAESRGRHLSRFMGWEEPFALGVLAYIWHEAQERLRPTAMPTAIKTWSCLPADSADKFFEGLVEFEFITELDSGEYEIHGCKEQIESRLKMLAASRKGAESTRKKWEKIKRAEGHADSSKKRGPSPGPIQGNARQCKAMQGNVTGSKKLPNGKKKTPNARSKDPELNFPAPTDAPKKKTPKKKDPPTDTTLVWRAYSEAYERRYGQPAKPNAKNMALAKQMVARLGKDDAIKAVAFYLTHNDQWYVKTGHALEYCVKHAEKIFLESSVGQQITSEMARRAENRTGNIQTLKNWAMEDE